MPPLCLTSGRITLALFFSLSITPATACDETLGWQHFSTATLDSKTKAGSLELRRFADGLYARVDTDKGRQEMIQAPGGVLLYRAEPAELHDTKAFFMLDMPVRLVLSLLAIPFERPCGISNTAKAFDYPHPHSKRPMQVRGSARRINDSTIAYDLSTVEQGEGGATIQAVGQIEFSRPVPLPGETSVAGWIVKRAGDTDAQPELGREGETLQALMRRLRTTSKPR